MGEKTFIYRLFYVLQLTCIFLLLNTCVWVFLTVHKYDRSVFMNKTWLSFQLTTLPCSLGEACSRFNVTCYPNGKVIFYGINHTAYRGMKTIQLEKQRINILDEFIRKRSFLSDFRSIQILFQIQVSYHYNRVYYWNKNNIDYTLLLSHLNIEELLSYKRRSINSNEKLKPWKKYPLTKSSAQASNRSMIPISKRSFVVNNSSVHHKMKSTRVIRMLFDDGGDSCFSSDMNVSGFDLIDACLSTNDVVKANQFYSLKQVVDVLNQTISPTITMASIGKFNFGYYYVEVYYLI